MRLKVILLLDSFIVSAWVYEALSQIRKENNAKIVLAIVNQSPKSSGGKSPFLYRVYRGLDRKLFLTTPDAFAQKDLRTMEGWDIPCMEIAPNQKKYSDYFQEADISKIKSYTPDIILRFGFRILRGEILKASTLGVWSFHHGDNQFYKGGPPAFWEVMMKKEITGVILQKLSEKLDDGLVLYKSYSQTDPLSVQRNANNVFWLSSYIISRVIRQIEVKGIEEWENSLQRLQVSKDLSVPLLKPPAFWQMTELWMRLMRRNLKRKISEKLKKPYWELLVTEKNDDTQLLHPSSLTFQSIKPPKGVLPRGSFWADPFPVEKDGKTCVFFEEFDDKSRKGRIAVGMWDGKSLSEREIVLEEEWHLSFPFIWEENNEFYLIPESGEANKTFIYKATNFPFQWKKIGVLMEGEAYDPTILKIDDLYWLFVNKRPQKGTSSFVELYAYYSPSLLEPSWTPHALNPVVSDVRSSRPAGRIYRKNGKLYRPAQDSGLRYGHRVKIQEILKLTVDEYQEETVDIIESDSSKNMLGTHTFNFTDKWIFSDAYYRR